MIISEMLKTEYYYPTVQLFTQHTMADFLHIETAIPSYQQVLLETTPLHDQGVYVVYHEHLL